MSCANRCIKGAMFGYCHIIKKKNFFYFLSYFYASYKCALADYVVA